MVPVVTLTLNGLNAKKRQVFRPASGLEETFVGNSG